MEIRFLHASQIVAIRANALPILPGGLCLSATNSHRRRLRLGRHVRHVSPTKPRVSLHDSGFIASSARSASTRGIVGSTASPSLPRVASRLLRVFARFSLRLLFSRALHVVLDAASSGAQPASRPRSRPLRLTVLGHRVDNRPSNRLPEDCFIAPPNSPHCSEVNSASKRSRCISPTRFPSRSRRPQLADGCVGNGKISLDHGRGARARPSDRIPPYAGRPFSGAARMTFVNCRGCARAATQDRRITACPDENCWPFGPTGRPEGLPYFFRRAVQGRTTQSFIRFRELKPILPNISKSVRLNVLAPSASALLASSARR